MRKVLPFFILMLMGITVLGQQFVSGTVKDAESGEPIPGATVLIKGTATGTTTDLDGKYKIEVKGDESILVFSFIGYESREEPVGSRTIIDVSMEADITQLGEVVVTALGIEKDSRTLGYAVSSIDGEQFTKAREISVADNLVGKIAGVNSSSTATGPGGTSRVTIRGNSSLSSNNQPLYVINGVQMNNDNLGSVGTWDGADFGDGISSINPDDIADITVLKGGAAAALYGQRGRNGVILITTKSGKSGTGLGIEFNSNIAFDVVNDFREFQTEYGQGTLGAAPVDQAAAMNIGYSSWGGKLNGSNVTLFNGEQHPYSAVSDDNLDKFYETGVTYTNSLAISGGGESGSVRLSLGDLRNSSVYPNSNYERKTVNLDASYKLSPKWSANANVNYTKDGGNRSKVNDSPGNGNFGIMFLPPNIDASLLKPGYDEAKNETQFSNDVWTTNPYFAAKRFITETKKDRVLSVASMRFTPLEWLYVQARITNDFYTFNATQITPTGTAYNPGGVLNVERTVNFNETNTDILVGINKDLGPDFSLGVTLGGNILKMKQKTIDGNATGFAFPFLYNPGTATTNGFSISEPQKEIQSLYGSVELGYRDMIFLNFTDRNDWSSTLPSSNNSYNYPSVNLSYVFSESINVSWMDLGKLRVGYARVGGDAPIFATNLYYGTMGNPINGRSLGNIDNTVPNPLIEPLQVTEIEVGTELRLLNNRAFVDFAWYNKQTLNDIVNGSVSRASGYQAAVVNVGKIENKGIELLVGGTPVKTPLLSWTTSFNFAHNQNKVIELAEGQESLQLLEARTRRAFIQHIPGKPFSQVMAYDYMRDDSGELVLGPTGLPLAASELTAQGTAVHPITGGWSNDIQIKNFSFSFLIDFKYGGVIYSGTNAIAYRQGLHKATLEGREGDISISGVDEDGNAVNATLIPQNYYGALANISKLQVYDADFIKFRSFSVTYNFPSMGKIKGLALSVVGRNLFYIKKSTPNIDPEANYSGTNAQGVEFLGVPSTRTLGINLSAKF